MSAAPRDPSASDDLRPTRENPPGRDAQLRPTREPRAPFVAGPESPRIAPAPRAAAVRGLPPATGLALAIVIASFPRELAPRVISALGERSLNATALHRAEPGASGLARELSHALRRATIAATCAGSIGALLGALLVPSEALIPGFGWIPGPAIGAGFCAGVLGALGFAIGMLALLVAPVRVLAPLAEGDRVLFAVAAPDVATAIAAILELGGQTVAHE